MSGWCIRRIAAAALFALLSGTGPVIAEDTAPAVVRQAGPAAVRLDLAGDWRIVAPLSDRVARCAAAELALTLERITRKQFPVVSSGERGVRVIVLSHGRDGDSFRWRAAADTVEISGDGARGLLYGAYDFLEALGCRWVEPGGRGERLPSGTSLTLARSFSRQAPSFKGRCLIIGHAAFMADAGGWTIWAARNRLNTVFIHVTTESLAFGAAPEKQWEKKRDAVLEMMKDRGMVIEYGGHRLASFLPRDLFKKTPGMFRMAGGSVRPLLISVHQALRHLPLFNGTRRNTSVNTRTLTFSMPGPTTFSAAVGARARNARATRRRNRRSWPSMPSPPFCRR